MREPPPPSARSRHIDYAEVSEVGPGPAAHIHYVGCRLSMLLLHHVARDRGVRRVARLLGRAFGREGYVTFRVFGERKVRVLLADQYWIAPLLVNRCYEPEIDFVLSHVMSDDHTFVDCGANIGWWSVFATTRIHEKHRILAIEPSSAVFGQLRENARLNEERFLCIKAAVWNRTGQRLSLLSRGDRHAGSTVKPDTGTTGWRSHREEPARSITLDDAIDEHIPDAGELIVKLDVGGAEIEALEGATRHLASVALMVYEEHAKDPEETMSRALIDLGYRVFSCDDALELTEMKDTGHVRSVKETAWRGHNFFACRPGSAVHERMLRLAGPS